MKVHIKVKAYCMSKRSCQFFKSDYTNKNEQDLFDIQNVQCTCNQYARKERENKKS